MVLEKYIHKAGKKLRLGFTTGTCAALAAKAATRMLLSGRLGAETSLVTPKGIRVEAKLIDAETSPESARCAVRKDAGDDPDSTDGILVYATVTRIPGKDVVIDGGAGVGRVTRDGLDQPVGAAAINRIPRLMIAAEATEVAEEFGYGGGLRVEISIPEGQAIAPRTFNPKLGIVGGISVIGTSGIVEPMSDRAIVDTIALEMKMARADGCVDLILTPGNYGESFIASKPEFAEKRHVKCSNHLGEAIDMAVELSFSRIIVAGHIGKLIKVAGGIMNTHSRMADCRLDLLALHAGLAGETPETLRSIMDAPTVDAGLEILAAHGSMDAVLTSLLRRIDQYLADRSGGVFPIGAVLFSNRLELVRASDNARNIMKEWNPIHVQR